jgi:hypothetical protein
MLGRYSSSEFKKIFLQPTVCWPEDFCCIVNRELADHLLDNWFEQHSDEEYRNEIYDIVENLTSFYNT